MKSKEDNTQKKSKKLSSKELSWVLYDVGNSAYTLLACALIPIWYKSLAVGDGAGQISSDRATAYYAVAIAVMTVVSALIGPVCGAIADHMRIKKAIFSTTVVVGVSACILCRIYYNIRKKQTAPHIRAKLFHAHNRLVIE